MRADFGVVMFMFISIICIQLITVDGYFENEQMKVCIGTNSRLSVPSNREHHYRNLRDRFTNCTYVDGNLELTWLQDANLDLAFLQHIREVTGYILISHVDIHNIALPKLQIIRGRTLFKLNVREEHFALFVTYSQMYTLELPALRDILQGSVGLFNNFNLCHIKSVNWDEIITGPAATLKYVYNFTAPERECPKCHKSCEAGCWGEGPYNCQKFSKINCSPQCAQGRCFGSKPRDCCHLFCAGGCTGPTQTDCLACRNFYDDGVCKQECPPMQKYNPTNYLWEPNPEGKFAYGATCVKNCPEHLLRDNGACVRTCPPNKMAENGECVPCNGACPKTCAGVQVLDSGNIDSFKGCTVIEGSIRVLDQSFAGYQEVYKNFSFGPRYVKMHPDRLEVFSTVKEVTGFVDIQGAHVDFKNLSYFRNLEIIHGRQLMENYFASFYIVKTSLRSLELRSLRRINSGAVVIQENADLCFAEEIDWSRLQKSKDHGAVIAKNKALIECKNSGLICSEQCSVAGCWGAGPDQCLECRNFRLNDTCLENCHMISNLYQVDAKTCGTCDHECISCTGPEPDSCTACVNVRDDRFCFSKCPETKYADHGICKPCHETCERCTGPENTIGNNGCVTCDRAIINGDATVVRCLKKQENCPDGYYQEYVMPQELGPLKPLAGKAICRQCHPRCEKCTNYGFHEKVCQKCAIYKRGEQCEDECPADHYADEVNRECLPCHTECRGCYGSGAENCLSCRNYKIYEDGDINDNSTLFNCTSSCPKDYPYKIFSSVNLTPYCAANPAPTNRLTASSESSIILISVFVSLILILCALLFIAHSSRQKTKAKKEAVKMTMVLAGCEDSEPLRPSNVGPNLSKLRIVKEAELRKGRALGHGAFGRVYQGVWLPEGESIKIPVAIKELTKVSGPESSTEFLEEAYIMASIEHRNLLNLLAVCMTSQMMLITQLMPLGCLLDYVKTNKKKIGSKALLNWSRQIASGMEYLEERRLVHRDLAARNVLVQTPSCVKITDFGLAKLLSSETNEYKAVDGKLPIKWLALESLQHRVFTSKSDVWAFGVTIWELLTFGQRPHENTPANELTALIEDGLKLDQPEICSLDVYCTLLSCWHLEAEMRPTFKHLVAKFAEYASDPGHYLKIEGDKSAKLPSYSSQDEKVAIRKLTACDNDEEICVSMDYLHPKKLYSRKTDEETAHPSSHYGGDPIKVDNETDPSTREVGIGNLRLDLPLDEDDYLMPTCQTQRNSKLPNGYMDLIGVSSSIDNPEYLNGAQCLNNFNTTIPSQTVGIPVLQMEGEQLSSDHEYYNDMQRELQPLHRNETTV